MYTYEISYSIESRKKVFVESYGFLSFAKNMNKVVDKNIRKKLSTKYGKKFCIVLSN